MANRVALVLAIAGVGISVGSCNSQLDPICCKDFNPGANMWFGTFTLDPATNIRIRAVAQGAGDLAAVTATSAGELRAACKRIAVDLGASPDEPSGIGNDKQLAFWCDTAKAKLDPLRGTFTLRFHPARCSMDIDSSTKCKARCMGGPPCNLAANPPKCTAGELEIACHGGCSGQQGVWCAGVCSGMCEGTCETTSNAATVECQGKCDGSCSVAPAMDGTCVGTCSGKCSYFWMPPPIDCKGKCTGSCSGKCTPPPGSATVECDGKCDADFDAIRCTGGKLQGGCPIDPTCETSCNASVSAKADCAPPTFELTLLPGAPVDLRSTLEATIPTIGSIVQGRGTLFADQIAAMANVSAALVGDGKLDAFGLSCLGFIGDSLTSTSAEFATMLTTATTVATSIGM